ncbi:flagellar assembly protein FliW [Microbacterium sp.]|uniref:flagellar assembly protein FliW n=1 Tax=Microbacterium sp. TaxID=51671 RepID=UPI003A90B8E1
MSVVLSFTSPPPGLAPHTAFTLDPVEGAAGLFAMHAVGDRLRVYLVDPQSVMAGYAPTLTDQQAADLALTGPGDALVLVVAHPTDGGVAVNLMAPVVVNRATGAAAQVILEDQGYPLRMMLS